MAPADGDARGVARNQRAGDADVDPLAEELSGIEHAEGEADHRRDGRERDVALGEIEPNADDLTALPHAAADDAGIRNGGGIGTGPRTGEGEAGHFLAAREAGQVMALLLLGAIVVEQLGGAERIGHRDGGGAGGAAARELGEHAGMRVGGELEAAIALGDDHREEAARLEEIPDLRRHVAQLMGDGPVIDHPAQLFARPVEEGLLLGGQLRRAGRQQLRPLGRAREQLPVPPDRAGLQCLPLRLRHRRQQLQVGLHERPGDDRLAQRPQIEQPQPREQQPEESLPCPGRRARGPEERIDDEESGEGRGEREQR